VTPLTEAQLRARERNRQHREREEQEALERERAREQAVADAQDDLPRLLRTELAQFSPWKREFDPEEGSYLRQLYGEELADAIIALPSVQRLLAALETPPSETPLSEHP
jgi:hypothetical protein